MVGFFSGRHHRTALGVSKIKNHGGSELQITPPQKKNKKQSSGCRSVKQAALSTGLGCRRLTKAFLKLHLPPHTFLHFKEALLIQSLSSSTDNSAAKATCPFSLDSACLSFLPRSAVGAGERQQGSSRLPPSSPLLLGSPRILPAFV